MTDSTHPLVTKALANVSHYLTFDEQAGWQEREHYRAWSLTIDTRTPRKKALVKMREVFDQDFKSEVPFAIFCGTLILASLLLTILNSPWGILLGAALTPVIVFTIFFAICAIKSKKMLSLFGKDTSNKWDQAHFAAIKQRTHSNKLIAPYDTYAVVIDEDEPAYALFRYRSASEHKVKSSIVIKIPVPENFKEMAELGVELADVAAQLEEKSRQAYEEALAAAGVDAQLLKLENGTSKQTSVAIMKTAVGQK